jgi:putative transposase
MARKRFTQEQIVAILREAERGMNRPALFRKHGICEQTFYRWKRMYGGLGVSEVRRIKELEEENRKLKQLAGEQALVIETMKDYQKQRGWL